MKNNAGLQSITDAFTLSIRLKMYEKTTICNTFMLCTPECQIMMILLLKFIQLEFQSKFAESFIANSNNS
jgi:hypothetical protein